MHVYRVRVSPWGLEEGTRSPRTGITGLSVVTWELEAKVASSAKHPVLSTAEVSLQPLGMLYF